MKALNLKVFLFLASFSVVILIQRLYTLEEPLGCDNTSYALFAQELRHGRRLYSDLWANKPPGIIVTYALAQSLTHSPSGALLLLETALSVLTLIGVYAAVIWMTENTGAGIWAAVFWTLSNATPHLEANQPCSDAIVNLFLVWGVAFLFRAGFAKPELGDLWRAGICLALSTYCKQNAVVAQFLILGVYLSVHLGTERLDHKNIRNEIVALIGPMIILWTALFLYFSMTKRFDYFWKAMVTSSVEYAFKPGTWHGPLANLVHSFDPAVLADASFRGIFYGLMPPALAALPGIAFAFINKDRRWILGIGYAVSAWVMMAFPGRYYSHYYLLLLPPLCILAGATLDSLQRSTKWIPDRWISTAWLATVSMVLFLREAPFYFKDVQAWSKIKFGDEYLTIQRMANEINLNLLPDETFYDAGLETGLYYYSGRRPPTGVWWGFDWESGPMSKQLSDRLIKELEQNRPELFITTDAWLEGKGRLDLPVMKWAFEHYKPLNQNSKRGPFLLYARKGGALEKRLALPRHTANLKTTP